MKQKAIAIGGGLLLGVVAVFTLVSLLKAAVGLAVIFFAGRGLIRLWMTGGHPSHSGHYFRPHESYPALGASSPYQAQSAQPAAWGAHPQHSGIVPIW